MLEFPIDHGHAPIILVRETAWAATAVCDVLDRFPSAVRLVERLSTRPPLDRFDERVFCCVPPDTFDLLCEADRVVALTRQEERSEAFLRVAMNQVLGGESKTFGIAIGDETVEEMLRKEEYDVRTFVLPPEGINSPEWDADRLAEFVFGLLDPDGDLDALAP